MATESGLPYDFKNGDPVDLTRVQANFVALGAGKGFKQDTLANLKTFAATAPTVPFLALATDIRMLVLYCGDATAGTASDGFITLGGY